MWRLTNQIRVFRRAKPAGRPSSPVRIGLTAATITDPSADHSVCRNVPEHVRGRRLAFSLALMTTLLAHELGHFLQARRYGVPASLPYFIPMPLSPIGTMGAVIVMAPGKGDRRTLFDIAVTGPLAGLVPALLFCILGLHWSQVVQLAANRWD